MSSAKDDIPERPKCSHAEPLVLPDGNFTLLIKDATVQVNGLKMASSSSVFAKIWSGRPDPFSGVATVQLDEDPADVINIINALYDINSILSKGASDPSILASLLYMSDKYDCNSVHNAVAARIRTAFPTTLALWDHSQSQDPLAQLTLPRGSEFDLLNMALKYGIQTATPAIYYRIAQRYTEREVKRGIERSDGSIARLTTCDQSTVIRARRNLDSEQRKLTWGWLLAGMRTYRRTYNPIVNAPGCELPSSCNAAREAICSSLFASSREIDIQALTPWDPAWDTQLCGTCGRLGRAAHRDGRIQIWSKFDTDDGWKVLRDAEAKPRAQSTQPSFTYV